MSVYINGKNVKKPYINGQKYNGYLAGKKLWLGGGEISLTDNTLRSGGAGGWVCWPELYEQLYGLDLDCTIILRKYYPDKTPYATETIPSYSTFEMLEDEGYGSTPNKGNLCLSVGGVGYWGSIELISCKPIIVPAGLPSGVRRANGSGNCCWTIRDYSYDIHTDEFCYLDIQVYNSSGTLLYTDYNTWDASWDWACYYIGVGNYGKLTNIYCSY